MRWRCSACRTENLGRHKACVHCSKPKDTEPFYDAPEAAAPSLEQAVADERLVALATAGADWECRYCGVHQPRSRTRCENCGAPEREAEEAAQANPVAHASPTEAPRPRSGRRRWGIVLAGLFCVVAGLFWLLRARVVEGRVVARTWQHTVVVERYQVVRGEGFAETQPPQSFDVVRVGERHHHYQKVQDGTEREAYTEQVSCGQDCSTTPVECTSNSNGFKTCRGGDRVCSTRYCSQTRYRDVPRYKDVSVSAPWFTWRAWQWEKARSIVEKGSAEPPRWPSDERVALDESNGPGEKERARREAQYDVSFEDEAHTRYPYKPRDLSEFSALALGKTEQLRVGPGRATQIVQQTAKASQ